MDREHSFITIRLRTDKQLLGTNQTLISRKKQEQVRQQNQTGHVYVRITIDTGATMYRVMFNLYLNCIKRGVCGFSPRNFFTELGTKLGNSRQFQTRQMTYMYSVAATTRG